MHIECIIGRKKSVCTPGTQEMGRISKFCRGYKEAIHFKIIRQLLIVAASDTKVETSELDVIYVFAKEFGVTKQEIGVLIAQMGLR